MATTGSAHSRAAPTVDLNAVDFGAAYLPQNQDPTLAPARCPGANALHDQPAAAVSAASATSTSSSTKFWDTYHSIQTSFNRRFRDGFSFGVNYTLGLSLKGNTGLQ